MGTESTFVAAGMALALLLVAAFASRRRGIGRWSLLPWDYLMILAATLLAVALAHLAILWRDGRM